MSDEQILDNDEQLADTASDESLEAMDAAEDDPTLGDAKFR